MPQLFDSNLNMCNTHTYTSSEFRSFPKCKMIDGGWVEEESITSWFKLFSF